MDCPEKVRTTLLNPTSVIYSEILNAVSENPSLAGSVSTSTVFCVVSSMSLVHQRHEVSPIRKNSIVITRTSSVLSNPETRKALDTFIKFSGNVRGATLRATQFIEQEVDGFEVPEDVIRNEMTNPRFDKDEVHEFVERLRAEKN